MDNNDVEVPPFFLCPISLEILRDPVTVSTGITYDRESIETWLSIQALHGSRRAIEFLASVINTTSQDQSSASEDGSLLDIKSPSDDALCILYDLQLSVPGLKSLVAKDSEFTESLTLVMKRGPYESRAYAVLLLKLMFEVAEPMQIITLKQEFLPRQSKIKAIESGAVSVLIELLLDCSDRRTSELILMLLEMLCQCAEGRSELLTHGAGIAVVSKKILRVSQVASEKAVRILLSVSKFSATGSVAQEMLQLGVAAKLFLVLQMDCGRKIKEKATEILKLHARVWKHSPCIPSNFLSSYPS
ncbi:hypothetical protein NL676_003718 [Syzygium grande]|nr:hypothetical protein NL676_003718 [Syzygium grande]